MKEESAYCHAGHAARQNGCSIAVRPHPIRPQHPGNIWRGNEGSKQKQKLIAKIVYIIFRNTFLHRLFPLHNHAACGHHHDRDVNAARNLLAKAKEMIAV